MKILKVLNGTRQIFDTENVTSVEHGRGFTSLTPLHHTHNTTDYEFLHRYFQEGHIIYSGFCNACYYNMDKLRS